MRISVELTPQKTYLFAASSLILIGAAFGPTKNPYGKDFDELVVPGLLLPNCFQWLLLSLRLRWRIAGLFCSLFAGIFICRVYTRVHLQNFIVILLLGMLMHATALWTFATEWRDRSVIVVNHLILAFVILIGVELRLTGISNQLGTGTAGFLFWAPMFALLLWAAGVAFKREKEAWVALVCAIFQVGIGLFDLGAGWKISWGIPGAVSVWFAAMGLTVYLAKTWKRQVQQ